ncbi:MAG: hypothetical protein ABSF09_04610 [Candidatus Bathyarchaeia archaeon]
MSQSILPKSVDTIALGVSKNVHCEHDYSEKTWICGKCGYEINPDVLKKIAETSWGKISSTTVY